MKKLLPLFLVVALLAGCGSIRKVETGAVSVGDRLTMKIDSHWNHVDFPFTKPAQLWTLEGVSIDELRIYAGIRDGQAVHTAPAGGKKKDVVFRSAMPLEDVVSMFEAVQSQDDSTFKLSRVEPYPFAGRKGIRFEYERIRKGDSVVQNGIGFATIDKGELFALVYQAPRLTFFPRYKARVEAMAGSAQLK